MLTTFDRILRAWRRKVRLEAALSYRESDRRGARGGGKGGRAPAPPT